MFDFDFDTNEMVQEASYDAASSGFKDLFDEKFTSFNPENIVSTGNNKLRSGMFDMDIEDSDLAIGYKNDPPAATPRPGRFMD